MDNIADTYSYLPEPEVPVIIPNSQRSGYLFIKHYELNSAGLKEPARTTRLFVSFYGRETPPVSVMERVPERYNHNVMEVTYYDCN